MRTFLNIIPHRYEDSCVCSLRLLFALECYEQAEWVSERKREVAAAHCAAWFAYAA